MSIYLEVSLPVGYIDGSSLSLRDELHKEGLDAEVVERASLATFSDASILPVVIVTVIVTGVTNGFLSAAGQDAWTAVKATILKTWEWLANKKKNQRHRTILVLKDDNRALQLHPETRQGVEQLEQALRYIDSLNTSENLFFLEQEHKWITEEEFYSNTHRAVDWLLSGEPDERGERRKFLTNIIDAYKNNRRTDRETN